MRRTLVAVLVVGVVGAVLISVATGATPRTKTVSFTGTVSGAGISATQAAFKYHDTYFGDAAGIQTTVYDAATSTGSDKNVIYYGRGVQKAVDTFTIGTPDANGIASITGKGTAGGGTGRFKGVTGTFTITGTVDTKGGTFKATLKGKYKVPR